MVSQFCLGASDKRPAVSDIAVEIFLFFFFVVVDDVVSLCLVFFNLDNLYCQCQLLKVLYTSERGIDGQCGGE